MDALEEWLALNLFDGGTSFTYRMHNIRDTYVVIEADEPLAWWFLWGDNHKTHPDYCDYRVLDSFPSHTSASKRAYTKFPR